MNPTRIVHSNGFPPALPFPYTTLFRSNMVERAVILSQDGMLHNPLHNQRTGSAWEDSDPALILETLEEAGWVVGGPRGAAAKLGLKRTTLLAKMKRLGISRPISQEGTEMFDMARESIC